MGIYMDDTYIEAQPALLPSVSGKLKTLNYFTWWMPVFVIAWLIAYLSMFSNPVELFQQNWPLFFVGFIGALLGNATAVGGGVIFIPVMLFIYQLPAVIALKLAIASQSFGMTSGALGWLKRGVVPTKLLWITIPPLLLGSLISSLAIKPNAFLIKGLFGPASIFIGAITLILIGRYGGREDVPVKGYLPLAVMSLIGGTLTGWVAIGEGEVVAAFLMLVYGLRAEKGIGLGVVLLSINSIFLALIHQFFLGGIPWELAMFTGFGCVFGGRMGPYVSQWIGPKKLKIGFAVIAIADGMLFVYQFMTSYI
jgi:uncharacterized membrane protein YfcA